MMSLRIFGRALSAVKNGESRSTLRIVTRSLSSMQLSSRVNNARTACFANPMAFTKHATSADTQLQTCLKLNASEEPKVLRLPSTDLLSRDFVYTIPLGYYAPFRQSMIISDKDLPPIAHKEYSEPLGEQSIIIKDPGSNIVKQAARLIQIRKRKMKKHKLRKLRKKMRYVWAKVKQRKILKKEKIFMGQLLTRFTQADEFDAEQWVHEFLRKSATDPKTLIPVKPKRERPIRYVF